MARTRTLLELRTAIRQRADIVNDLSFITDPELNELINQSVCEFRDLMIMARGQDYFQATPYTLSTVAGQESYSLPADFYQLILAELTLGGYRLTLRRFELPEHGYYSTQSIPSGMPITLRYIPTAPILIADGDTFDGINGWEDYVILDGCIKVLAKEESDVSVYAAQLARMQARIDALKTDRDAVAAPRIWSVRKRADWRIPIYEPRPMYRVIGPNIEFVYGEPVWGV